VCLHSSASFTVALLKGQHIKIVARTISEHQSQACGVDHEHTSSAAAPCVQPGVQVYASGSEPELAANSREISKRALVLEPPHHGKIVHACKCLCLASALIVVVTVAEDGCVRALQFR
jgi:hypothetical protein